LSGTSPSLPRKEKKRKEKRKGKEKKGKEKKGKKERKIEKEKRGLGGLRDHPNPKRSTYTIYIPLTP
jgi:hypothetical protein